MASPAALARSRGFIHALVSVVSVALCPAGRIGQRYIQQDGRFDDTSVWVVGERRLVTLKGCVQSQAQSDALEKAVWLVDDVMGVINLLQVGTDAAAARYPLAVPQKP